MGNDNGEGEAMSGVEDQGNDDMLQELFRRAGGMPAEPTDEEMAKWPVEHAVQIAFIGGTAVVLLSHEAHTARLFQLVQTKNWISGYQVAHDGTKLRFKLNPHGIAGIQEVRFRIPPKEVCPPNKLPMRMLIEGVDEE